MLCIEYVSTLLSNMHSMLKADIVSQRTEALKLKWIVYL